MWLTDLMELGFGAAMLCLAIDIGGKYIGKRRPLVVGSIAIASLFLALLDLLQNWQSGSSNQTVLQPIVSQFASLFVINQFSVFVILTLLVVGIVVAIYSVTFLSSGDNVGPFFALLLLLITSIVGVASAGDFLTLFLFWEGMSISAYGMVAFYKDSMPLSLEASLKYIFLAGVGSLVALYGISLVYSTVGSIQLSALSALLSRSSSTGILALLFMIFGFGVEAAIFPLQTWLPDVYSAAPIPISAIVSGIVTEAGVFTLVKIIQPFAGSNLEVFPSNLLKINSIQEVQLVIAVLAVATMFIGNLSGLVQTNLKRILAFSSIAQMGYMIAALSTFSLPGLVAVVFNIWNHGIVKSNFFLLGGLGGRNYEDAELEKLQGLGQKNRIVGVLFGSSSLAMVGSPPFGIFWSEILIVESLISASSTIFFLVGVTVVLNIFMSIGYYAKIINKVALTPPVETSIMPQKISLGMLIPPIILIALSLLTGILPFLFLNRIT